MALAKRIKSYFRSSLGPPQRVVDEGWVWCPRNGNVKVEECMHCTRLVEYDLSDETPWISCQDPAEELRHIWTGG